MSHASFKLINPLTKLVTEGVASPDAANAPSTLRFEQRSAKRHSVTGRATAVTKTRVPEGQQNRIRSLQLLNISDTGLGAICQDSFDVGSTIAIFLPPHGPDAGLDIYGHVVRCNATVNGHEIGIQFASKMAA